MSLPFEPECCPECGAELDYDGFCPDCDYDDLDGEFR